jgi:hypothetical protein
VIPLNGIRIQPMGQHLMEQSMIDMRQFGKARIPQQLGPKKLHCSIEAGDNDESRLPPVQQMPAVKFAVNVL